MSIEGENYPAPANNQMAERVIFFLQMALILSIVVGESLFQALGLAPPEFYILMTQNKFMSCLLIFFVGNAMRNFLLSTGAFEVYVDGEKVYSKLQTGQVPAAHQVASVITRQLGSRQRRSSDEQQESKSE